MDSVLTGDRLIEIFINASIYLVRVLSTNKSTRGLPKRFCEKNDQHLNVVYN